MSRDILLTYDEANNNMDISFADGDIVSDFTINSSVFTQIFTRSRLTDQQQPDKFLQNEWEGQSFFTNFIAGCGFENIIEQGKNDVNTLNQGINEIKKGLQFLIDMEVASNIDVEIIVDPFTSIKTLNVIVTEISGQEIFITQNLTAA